MLLNAEAGKSDDEIEDFLVNKFSDKKGRFAIQLHDVVPESDYDIVSPIAWLKTGKSVYGAFLQFVLFVDADAPSQPGIVLMITYPCVVVGGVQGVILYNLWYSLPPVYLNNDDFPSGLCSLGPRMLFFQTCIIGVFIVSVLPALYEALTELTIVWTAKIASQVINTGKLEFVSLSDGLVGRSLAFGVVLYELAIWVCVLLIGIQYILTTEGAGNIVQAAVAISYINEIDNMAVIILAGFTKIIEARQFRCRKLIPDGAFSLLSFFFLLPIIIASSCGIVYVLYNTYCH
jgi:hypothetical protein